MQAMNITASKIFEQTMQRVAPLPCQESYARNLANILSVHLHRNQLIDEGWLPDELPYMSAIVVAPTGQGKTYLIRKMSEILGLNLVTIDCATLVPEGYKGVSLSQRLSNAVTAAKDKETFCRSILFFDEIDKIRSSDGFTTNRMSSILQLFNGSAIEIEDGAHNAESIDLSRSVVLFGGAFVGLEDIIRNRVCPKPAMGFSAEAPCEALNDAQLLEQATLEDMAKYGIMPELLGRIGTVLSIMPLTLEDYRQLLTADSGSLKAKYQAYLRALYGVNFEISDVGVEEIATQCMKASTGARAATPLVNDLMRSAIATVEDDDSICTVILDSDVDGCCIRYTHGPREPVYQFCDRQARHKAANEAEAKLPVHTVKPSNEHAAVKSLLRYFRNANGNLLDIPALSPFLDLTVRFLHRKCKTSEFSLLNMIKLAEAVQKNRKSGKSPFQIIMEDYHYANLPAYKELDNLYNIWTARELVAALNTVREYLFEKHGPCQILFVVPKDK